MKPKNTEERSWLVQFFDKGSTYGWANAGKLDLLGSHQGMFTEIVGSNNG